MRRGAALKCWEFLDRSPVGKEVFLSFFNRNIRLGGVLPPTFGAFVVAVAKTSTRALRRFCGCLSSFKYVCTLERQHPAHVQEQS